jgi:hypothetical protein
LLTAGRVQCVVSVSQPRAEFTDVIIGTEQTVALTLSNAGALATDFVLTDITCGPCCAVPGLCAV